MSNLQFVDANGNTKPFERSSAIRCIQENGKKYYIDRRAVRQLKINSAAPNEIVIDGEHQDVKIFGGKSYVPMDFFINTTVRVIRFPGVNTDLEYSCGAGNTAKVIGILRDTNNLIPDESLAECIKNCIEYENYNCLLVLKDLCPNWDKAIARLVMSDLEFKEFNRVVSAILFPCCGDRLFYPRCPTQFVDGLIDFKYTPEVGGSDEDAPLHEANFYFLVRNKYVTDSLYSYALEKNPDVAKTIAKYYDCSKYRKAEPVEPAKTEAVEPNYKQQLLEIQAQLEAIAKNLK